MKDEKNVAELFRLIVEERMRLRDAAVLGVKQPYTLVYAFLHDGAEMQKRYEGALAAVADDLAHEALAIADEQAEVKKEDGTTYDPDVARDKLRVDTRLRMASKWSRERYGESQDSQKVVPVIIQVADLRGATVQLPVAKSLPMREE